jgi:hypothetical protein
MKSFESLLVWVVLFLGLNLNLYAATYNKGQTLSSSQNSYFAGTTIIIYKNDTMNFTVNTRNYLDSVKQDLPISWQVYNYGNNKQTPIKNETLKYYKYYYSTKDSSYSNTFNYIGTYDIKFNVYPPDKGGYTAIYWKVKVLQPNQKPHPVTYINQTDHTHNSITIKWGGAYDNDGQISRYYIEYTNNNYDSWHSCGDTSKTTKTCYQLSENEDYKFRIRDKDNNVAYSDWEESSYFYTNRPPKKTISPNPSNGYTNHSYAKVYFSWNTGGDPDNDGLKYWVYLGTNKNSMTNITSTTSTYYTYSNQLSPNTKYYWRVDSYDGYVTTKGIVWNFTTAQKPNSKPTQAYYPTPSNSVSGVSADNPSLNWNKSTDKDGDTVKYKIYFGTNSSSPTYKYTQSTTNYHPGQLQYNTKYYWRVDSYDGKDTTTGNIWSFTTKQQKKIVKAYWQANTDGSTLFVEGQEATVAVQTENIPSESIVTFDIYETNAFPYSGACSGTKAGSVQGTVSKHGDGKYYATAKWKTEWTYDGLGKPDFCFQAYVVNESGIKKDSSEYINVRQVDKNDIDIGDRGYDTNKPFSITQNIKPYIDIKNKLNIPIDLNITVFAFHFQDKATMYEINKHLSKIVKISANGNEKISFDYLLNNKDFLVNNDYSLYFEIQNIHNKSIRDLSPSVSPILEKAYKDNMKFTTQPNYEVIANYNIPGRLQIDLYDKNTFSLLPDQKLKVTVNGQTYTPTTGSQGYFWYAFKDLFVQKGNYGAPGIAYINNLNLNLPTTIKVEIEKNGKIAFSKNITLEPIKKADLSTNLKLDLSGEKINITNITFNADYSLSFNATDQNGNCIADENKLKKIALNIQKLHDLSIDNISLNEYLFGMKAIEVVTDIKKGVSLMGTITGAAAGLANESTKLVKLIFDIAQSVDMGSTTGDYVNDDILNIKYMFLTLDYYYKSKEYMKNAITNLEKLNLNMKNGKYISSVDIDSVNRYAFYASNTNSYGLKLIDKLENLNEIGSDKASLFGNFVMNGVPFGSTVFGNYFTKQFTDGVGKIKNYFANDIGSYLATKYQNSTQNPKFTNICKNSDSSSPNISIIGLQNKQIINIKNITLKGTATDNGHGDNGISSITVNGQNTDFTSVSGNQTSTWSKDITLNEGNNVITIKATDSLGNDKTTSLNLIYEKPVSDLSIVNYRVDPSIETGKNSGVDLVITNLGSIKSSETTINYYLSTDSKIDNSDTIADTVNLNSLDSKQTAIKIGYVQIIKDGSYWVYGCIEKSENETNTQNNCLEPQKVTAATKIIVKPEYTVTVTTDSGGYILPSDSVTLEQGLNKIFTITPHDGYRIKDILVDGVSQGAIPTYTISNIQEDKSIEAIFEKDKIGVAKIDMNTNSLTLPPQKVGIVSSQLSFGIKNIGDANLTLGTFNFNASGYSETDTCNENLIPDASCVLNITYTPSIAGTFTNQLSFVTNDPDMQNITIPIHVTVITDNNDTNNPSLTPTTIIASDGTYSDKVIISSYSVSGATSYEIYRSTSPGGYVSKISTTASTSYNDTSASSSGTHYYYRVKACNSGGCSNYSSYDSGYKKVVKQVINGDINNDNTTDISDVILVLKQATGKSPEDLSRADLNHDNVVDIADVILVLKQAIGKK